MTTTYNILQWNSDSVYHQERLGAVAADVDNYLLPRFLNTVKQGPISIADFSCGRGTITCDFVTKVESCGYTVKKILLIDVDESNLSIATEQVQTMFPHITVQTFQCNGHNFSNFDLNSLLKIK